MNSLNSIHSPRVGVGGQYTELMLPFTLDREKVSLPPAFRIKFDSNAEIHNKIFDVMIQEELRIKMNLLHRAIKEQRLQHLAQLIEYNQCLIDFIQRHPEEINLERTRLMLLTNQQQLKTLKSVEDRILRLRGQGEVRRGLELTPHPSVSDVRVENQKREPQKRAKGESDAQLHLEQLEVEPVAQGGPASTSRFKKIFLKDHLPFGTMVMQIVAKMSHPEIPNPPKFKVNCNARVLKDLLQSYHHQFDQAYKKKAEAARKSFFQDKAAKQRGS